jgi:hypothetical protein
MRLLAVFVAGLAATSAPAKPTAQLLVTALDTRPGVAAETDVELEVGTATTAVDVYVPAGYALDLGARPGTVIGTARTTDASSLVAAAPGVWTAKGLTVAIDRSTDGGYRLELSLARPVADVDLDIQRGLTNPPGGVATWRAFAGRIEVRSVVAFPQALTARAAFGGGALHVSGTLLFVGKPRAGVNVHLAVATREDFGDARELGTARTDAEGRYRLTTRIAARRQLLVIAYVNFYVGLCADCLDESISPPPAQVVAVG